jgi:hypothetical protein
MAKKRKTTTDPFGAVVLKAIKQEVNQKAASAFS